MPADASRSRDEELSGLAHLAAVSFLGSRLAPTGGYWVALAGGVAVARAAARHGLRAGYGATFASLAQSVAIMGPARFTIPLTQALNAPLLGRLEARGAGLLPQIAVAAAVRIALAAAGTAFFIWVILGGLDAYSGGYEWLTGWMGFLPEGSAGIVLLTLIGMVLWALFASPVQVLVYRRGMRRWPRDAHPDADARAASAGEAPRRRLDPRAVALAAAAGFAVLLLSADWPVLAVATAWLVLACVLARPERDFVPLGAALAAFLGAVAVIVGLMADAGLVTSLERGARAALLVAVATWFRAAAGTGGIREVARRAFGRVRFVPGARDAARMLADLGSGAAIVPTARALGDDLRDVQRRPLPFVDAVLRWVAAESHRFRPAPAVAPPRLGLRPVDVVVVALALAPAVPLVAGVASLGSV